MKPVYNWLQNELREVVLRLAKTWVALVAAIFLFFALPISAQGQMTVPEAYMAKAEAQISNGELFEAVSTFQEALEKYPEHINLNISAVVFYVDYHVQMENFRQEALRLISNLYDRKDQLTKPQLYRLALCKAKIALAVEAYAEAGDYYAKAVEIFPNSDSARLRLAALKLYLGKREEAGDMLLSMKDVGRINSPEDFRLHYFMNCNVGNFSLAYDSLQRLSDAALKSRGSKPSLKARIFWQPPLKFVIFMPISLKGIPAFLLWAVLFITLAAAVKPLASRYSFKYALGFVFTATIFSFACTQLIEKPMILAMLSDDFNLYSLSWILPKLLLANLFMSVALFLVFPAFSKLPGRFRPRDYELYGIWYFSISFIAFALVFQSRIPAKWSIPLSLIILLFASFFAQYVPLGRFVFFKTFSLFGLSNLFEFSSAKTKEKNLSLTEIKILESKAEEFLEQDNYHEVESIAARVFLEVPPESFPGLWRTYFISLLASFKFDDAAKTIDDYHKAFLSVPLGKLGYLYKAFLATEEGDYSTALKILKTFSEKILSDFSKDDVAVYLLAFSRCMISMKENVQASIELDRAYNMAKLPFLKAFALAELARLNRRMNASEAIKTCLAKFDNLRGGENTRAFRATVESISFDAANDDEKALEAAAYAYKNNISNDFALLWHGTLLAKAKKTDEAENLLARMNAKGRYAHDLLAVIAGQAAT